MTTAINTTTTGAAHVTTINAERFRDTVFFRVTVRRWGNRAKIKDGAKLTEYLKQKQAQPELATTAAPTVTGEVSGKITASKVLITSPALDAVNEHLTTTKERLVGRFGMAMQSNIQAGLFVAKVESVQTFEDIIDEAITKLNMELIPALRADYPAAIERARTLPVNQGGLGPLFDESDYADVDDVCDAFSLEHFWLSLNVPENLPASLRASAAERLERQFAEAETEVKLALREGFQQLIAHAAESLKPTADGEKKVFRNSLTDNIQAFIDSFNSRNVMGDTELAALVERARTVLTGVETGGKATADVIRKNADVKANIAKQFSAIAAELGGMIETERSRQFNFDEN